MEQITTESLELLRHRFGHFHDAVIHSITFGLFTDARLSSKTVRLLIGAPDLVATTSPALYEFVNIEFTLVGVESFALIKAWNHEISVLFHMDIHLHNERVYFVEGLGESDPDDIVFEDFINNTSSLYFVAKDAHYSISPYKTRDF